jgi:hypothetical protein
MGLGEIALMLPSLLQLALDVYQEFTKEAPLIKAEGEKSPKLQPPDKRLSWGITKRDGEPVLALLVEQSDSWAMRRAKSFDESNQKIIYTVTGLAHSSKVNEPITAKTSSNLVPGLSVGHFKGYAGTLGCFVTAKSKSSNQDCIGFVGASHVLGLVNTAKPGDDILHPCPPDGPRVKGNKVGILADFTYLIHHDESSEEINENLSPGNTEDIAAVMVDDQQKCPECNLVPDPKDPTREMKLKGQLSDTETIERIAEPVYKVGRTTGFTEGILEYASVSRYPIRLPDRKLYIYSNIIGVTFSEGKPFSEPGDSGSLVYTADGKAVGLIIGASDKVSFVSPISSCLTAMRASLLV